MDGLTNDSLPPARPPRRIVPIVLIAVAAVGVLAAGLSGWRGSRNGANLVPRIVSPGTTRPTVSNQSGSPFKNTHPSVDYVGDAACVRCHSEIAESFRRHPMGRSLSEVVAGSAVGSPGAKTLASFEANGARYVVEDTRGLVVHRESRLDTDGRTITEQEAAARFALGSGTRGISYLIDRDGYLTQSPITWFTTTKRWDLAPGYEKTNPHFERPVTAECLFCHSNRYKADRETSNRYREPVFDGQPIGCERCHGPGGLHVKRREVHDGRDLTIVNPRHLEPSLREDVCQQCHLKGDMRVARIGKDFLDYRPGLPLRHFISVFFREEGLKSRIQAVGHVEQMRASRCFHESNGQLGCISCHDPHAFPSPAEKTTYFRARCLECHADKPCALPEKTRLQKSRDDSCIACHMPPTKTVDIAHSAVSDHRIPRVPIAPAAADAQESSRPASAPTLVHFHGDQVEPEKQPNVQRDRGIALSWSASEMGGTESGLQMATEALRVLEPAIKADPNDISAREAKGLALSLIGRGNEALSELAVVLDKEPRRESTLVLTAMLASKFDTRQRAIESWRKALDINPLISVRQKALAELLAADDQWSEAAEVCRKSLLLNPSYADARMLLIRCYRKSGDDNRARKELEVLIALDPKNRERLARWFDEQG